MKDSVTDMSGEDDKVRQPAGASREGILRIWASLSMGSHCRG